MMEVNDLETAREKVDEEIRERFPDGKWHIVETRWADGDFKVKGIHTASHTDEGNCIREEVVCTPFDIKFQVVEITDEKSWITHKEVELEDD